MKQPGFIQGVIVAAALALTGAIAFAGLSVVASGAAALKIVTVALGGIYIVYLLVCSNEHTGRITIFMAWGVVTTTTWLLTTDLSMTLITQSVLISIVRTLFHHTRMLGGLLDFVLSAFALSTAVWAIGHSGSMLLTVWCFFLVQALSVYIPESLTNKEQQPPPENSVGEDKFGRAFRTAETAIRRS